jgi:hypothetical protein
LSLLLFEKLKGLYHFILPMKISNKCSYFFQLDIKSWPLLGHGEQETASTKTAQKVRFPLGELAQRRHDLKENFLSKSKELNALRKKHKMIKEKVSIIS